MDIVIQRGVIKQIEELQPYSIALDGFVSGPKRDSKNHRYSWDHHGKCIRDCTTACCQQAWAALLTGLSPEEYTIYANDVDLDVAMSIWLLNHPEKCTEVLVAKLVNAVGWNDMFGGALPQSIFNGLSKTVEWIAAPETDSKRNDDYSKISNEGLFSILEAVLHRIDLYVDGESSQEVAKQHKHGEYEIVRDKNDWILVKSQDPHIFSSLYQKGYERLVVIRPQSDKSLAVTLAKKSDYVDRFPLEKMYEEFNKIEPGAGGSSSIGGLVRASDGSRSRLPIETIIKIVDQCVLEEIK